MGQAEQDSLTDEWSAPEKDVPGRGGDPHVPPERIGRYRTVRLLGKGGFGRVFLAYDDELDRPVAIKVPHRERVARPEDVEAYLAEARILARLDHPHIVPVHDVGRTEDGLCYVVSKYVEGSDLAAIIRSARPPHRQAAVLAAAVAEALHHAHVRGLVHRDIKPANILIDSSGKPLVADFGLALRDEDYGTGPTVAGTPSYMSPEQARGEGHRVDGRSDIFSLGVILYELLTGRRPFRGETRRDLLEQVASAEARPPRQIDDTIPRELERICLKAMAKRASERYTTALDIAEDLRAYLKAVPDAAPSIAGPPTVSVVAGPTQQATPTPPTSGRPESDRHPVKVVPKGLRSFDEHDADFFLELVPGPRDRDGLPESLRFWKALIEETDADKSFRVGLIYGPSGCGKSSLIKAGLLPRLAKYIHPIYVEATAGETEARLLRGVRKVCPDLGPQAGMVDALASFRRGHCLRTGQKVLLVLDQFEHWLFANRGEEDTELVAALRQCDGEHVQAIVMVRDDFWMTATRFMRDLETDLVPDRNIAAVDLFDLRHARKVLMAFGQAYGALPEKHNDLTRDHQDFLDRAITGLSQDGRIIPVRLAVFAEMVRVRPWTPATLREVGGTEGVGVTFLEESFSSPQANPKHRIHQRAAQAVMRALVHESGTDLKGRMRSEAELRDTSGYAGRPRDFADLIRILDAELRLITPTDPEGSTDGGQTATPSGERYYQLAHDYLVPPLREWLARKQKETRRGRAELHLAERSALWNAKPENRRLPSAWEWASIRLLTGAKDWTEPQRRMMRRAGRIYALRGLGLAAIISGLVVTGLAIDRRVAEANQATHASGLVERLLDADTAQVPEIVRAMRGYRRWTDPQLGHIVAESERGSKRRLHASLALLPSEPSQIEYLRERLLTADENSFPVIRDSLQGREKSTIESLWSLCESIEADRDQRFRAACALASYDPMNPRWGKVVDAVANHLVVGDHTAVRHWIVAFRPIKMALADPLLKIFRDGGRGDTERSLAATAIADHFADDPVLLTGLLLEATDGQFVRLFPALVPHHERAVSLLSEELEGRAIGRSHDERESRTKRRANASVGLLRLGEEGRTWPLLRHTSDPTERSQLVNHLATMDVDPQILLKRLGVEEDVTIRRALLLALGDYSIGRLPQAERELIAPTILHLYRDDRDAGIRGAAEWVLRRWGQGEALARTDRVLARAEAESVRDWYVSGLGHTMTIVRGPVESLMGSTPDEVGRDQGEDRHRKRIDRSFAIGTKEVTVEQFQEFLTVKHLIASPAMERYRVYNPEPGCPVLYVSWYQAAAYCNWLSERAGLPADQWCYLPNGEGQFADGMRCAPDYLQRLGYRLPTEAEWEYACRAGATTRFSFGESDGLIGHYAWFPNISGGRTRPVGCLKPNDLGLFDMHGNLWERTQDVPRSYPVNGMGQAVEDRESSLVATDREPRVVRGGAFDSHPKDLRSAFRFLVSMRGFFSCGFRPARTGRP